MSGLFSQLAISTSVATSILMGNAVPPAPDIPSQEVSHEEYSSGKVISYSSSMEDRDKKESSSRSWSFSPSSSDSRDISRLLTGNDYTLDNISSPRGVDIASHQHPSSGSINIPRVVKDGGVTFAFIKATEGTHYTNPHFRGDVVKFRAFDVPVGFYHYAKPSYSTDDAREQARHFVDRTGIDRGVKSFYPVLDIEESNGVSDADALIAWVEAFVDEVKSLTGKDVMIYTYPSFWVNAMNNTDKFSHLPLWIAHYNNSTSPGEPLVGGWKNWVFWQYTSKGSVDGYSGEIDLNIFNGSEKQLRELYDSSGKNTGKKTTTVTTTVKAAR